VASSRVTSNTAGTSVRIRPNSESVEFVEVNRKSIHSTLFDGSMTVSPIETTSFCTNTERVPSNNPGDPSNDPVVVVHHDGPKSAINRAGHRPKQGRRRTVLGLLKANWLDQRGGTRYGLSNSTMPGAVFSSRARAERTTSS